MEDCVFCKIVAEKLPAYKIWEDNNYIAFLDIKPITKGMTLVVPKKHVDSYIVDTTLEETEAIMEAAKKVARILDEKLKSSLRTTIIFEGIDVNHLHAKLIPYYEDQHIDYKPFDTTPEELVELADYLAN